MLYRHLELSTNLRITCYAFKQCLNETDSMPSRHLRLFTNIIILIFMIIIHNNIDENNSRALPGHWWAHSPLMGAEAMAKAGEISLVGSAQGCDLEGNDTAGFAAATALATAADVPIVFVG